MDPWLFILFMVIVGAALGGMTNALAIRMLFRPYRAISIGRWKLPFTPGLIPKRRQEIAVQLGNMVSTYLLTAEGLEKQMKDQAFTSGISIWMEEELRHVLNSEQTLEEWLAENTGFEQIESIIFDRADQIISSGVSGWLHRNQEQKLRDMLRPELANRLHGYIPQISEAILQKATVYFESPEGKEKLSEMTEEFLDHKGRLGSMLHMFMGNERIVDKVQPEILQFLRNERTKLLVNELLEKEWMKLQDQPFSELSKYINEEKVSNFLSELVKKKVPVLRSLSTPLHTWAPMYEQQLFNTWVPSIINVLIEITAGRIGKILKALRLEDIITKQVESFSTKDLEGLVLSVASKELKLITYLGALIGGTVGLLQGVFVLFINGFS